MIIINDNCKQLYSMLEKRSYTTENVGEIETLATNIIVRFQLPCFRSIFY